MTIIARRTAKDFLRRQYRWRTVFGGVSSEAAKEHADPKSVSPKGLGDPQERIEFIVYEFFRNAGASCLKLAEAFFDKRDWQSVAADLGLKHDAVRARWSRCLSLLKKAVKSDPQLALLADWAGGGS